jgi:exportin-2 (importin alpha re-exporter)
MVATFEQTLFPAFQIVLEQDVQEFAPYVFQIFSQLIEIRTPPLPDVYMDSLFRPLLSPLLWERPGNVPALVRLLQVRCRISRNAMHVSHQSPIPNTLNESVK